MSRLLQAIHFFSGCRGAIVWEGSFLGQGRSDYDCFEAWGFVVPFHLKGPIHLFNIGQWSKEMRQIPLRADPAFARRVYFHDWLWTLIWPVIGGILLVPLLGMIKQAEEKPNWVLYGSLSLLFLLSLICIIVLMISQGGGGREPEKRNQSIRLLLGPHEWGSSDPALWHDDLVSLIVSPVKAFDVKSFASLARRYIKNRDWVMAMWAARLCGAVENQEKGEELTTAILAEPEVEKILSKLRKKPEKRKELLGEEISLTNWISENPKRYVSTCWAH
jgi:hypothetical protein